MNEPILAPQSVEPARGRVVVSDRHQLVRQALTRYLATTSLEVIATTGEGEQALRLVGELSPDLLITDIRLEGMDGLTLARKVREMFPYVRVVILTAYTDDQFRAEAEAAGVAAYLLKSASVEEVLSALRAVVDRDVDTDGSDLASVAGEDAPASPARAQAPGSSEVTPSLSAIGSTDAPLLQVFEVSLFEMFGPEQTSATFAWVDDELTSLPPGAAYWPWYQSQRNALASRLPEGVTGGHFRRSLPDEFKPDMSRFVLNEEILWQLTHGPEGGTQMWSGDTPCGNLPPIEGGWGTTGEGQIRADDVLRWFRTWKEQMDADITGTIADVQLLTGLPDVEVAPGVRMRINPDRLEELRAANRPNWSWEGNQLSGETRQVLFYGADLRQRVGVLWGEDMRWLAAGGLMGKRQVVAVVGPRSRIEEVAAGADFGGPVARVVEAPVERVFEAVRRDKSGKVEGGTWMRPEDVPSLRPPSQDPAPATRRLAVYSTILADEVSVLWGAYSVGRSSEGLLVARSVVGVIGPTNQMEELLDSQLREGGEDLVGEVDAPQTWLFEPTGREPKGALIGAWPD